MEMSPDTPAEIAQPAARLASENAAVTPASPRAIQPQEFEAMLQQAWLALQSPASVGSPQNN